MLLVAIGAFLAAALLLTRASSRGTMSRDRMVIASSIVGGVFLAVVVWILANMDPYYVSYFDTPAVHAALIGLVGAAGTALWQFNVGVRLPLLQYNVCPNSEHGTQGYERALAATLTRYRIDYLLVLLAVPLSFWLPDFTNFPEQGASVAAAVAGAGFALLLVQRRVRFAGSIIESSGEVLTVVADGFSAVRVVEPSGQFTPTIESGSGARWAVIAAPTAKGYGILAATDIVAATHAQLSGWDWWRLVLVGRWPLDRDGGRL